MAFEPVLASGAQPFENGVPGDLLEVAQAALGHAHAPYSRCRVGAALRVNDGSMWGGCNVENASYGATICAERGAVMSAVAALGAIEIIEVLVLVEGSTPWPPCGMCRQVLSEFAGPACRIWSVASSGSGLKSWHQPFGALMPGAFGPSFLGGEAR